MHVLAVVECRKRAVRSGTNTARVPGQMHLPFRNNLLWRCTLTRHPQTKLRSVKISNNTNPYTGDMGLWEINAAPLAADAMF